MWASGVKTRPDQKGRAQSDDGLCARAVRERRLATACVQQDGCFAGRWGDINGDCKLTAYDALWARQVYIGQRSYGDLCPWAQQQLDPTLDGEAHTVEDAIYLQLAAANKYRFLANVTVDSSLVIVTTALLDEDPHTDPAAPPAAAGATAPWVLTQA